MIQLVPHSIIRPSPLNPRKAIDADQLDELAESILQEGLLQNLVVRPNGDGYEIAAGERRWRAIDSLIKAQHVDADYQVPVVIRDLTDLQLLQLATTENMARADMSPLEEARAFTRMLELGSDVATIAAETGLSQRTVQTRLALVERLAPAAIEALENGQITLGQAQALTAGSFETQERLVNAKTFDGKPRIAFDTPASIRADIKREHIPVSRAAFPLERYLGELIAPSLFDPEGEAVFGDPDQFHKLQREYAEELLAEARRTWGWAELVDWFPSYNYDRVEGEPTDEDRAAAGVMIQLDDRTGVLEVHEGLIKRSQAASPSGLGSSKPQRDPLELTQKHHAAINEHRTRALQGALIDDPTGRMATVASIMGLLHLFWSDTLVRTETVDVDAAAPQVRQLLARYGKALEQEELVRIQYQYESRGDRQRNLIQALLVYTTGELRDLQTALIALHVRVGSEYSSSTTVDPTTRVLWHDADATGVLSLPTWRELGADWLLMYPKARLEQIYQEATGQEPGASLTRKNLAAGILDHATPGWLDQVPAELLVPEAPATSAVDEDDDVMEPWERRPDYENDELPDEEEGELA